MAEKIEEGSNLSPSEAQQKRDWDELINWCCEVERNVPFADAFLNAVRLANILTELSMPERVIESAWKLANRIEEKVRAIKANGR